jgi:hypothetical protein
MCYVHICSACNEYPETFARAFVCFAAPRMGSYGEFGDERAGAGAGAGASDAWTRADGSLVDWRILSFGDHLLIHVRCMLSAVLTHSWDGEMVGLDAR